MTQVRDSSGNAVSPGAPPAAWSRLYGRRLILTDLIMVAFAVFGSQWAWFASFQYFLVIPSAMVPIALNYTGISVAIVLVWVVALGAVGSREYRNIGSGNAEYRKVIDATVRVFALVAIIAFLFKAELARGYFFTALPIGLLLLLFSRWLWRLWLNAERSMGRATDAVLLVGSPNTVIPLHRELSRRTESGYRVVGVCLTSGPESGLLPGTSVPIVGRLDAALQAINDLGIDTVIVTGSDDLPPERVRELSWALEPGRRHLVMAPSMLDVSGPRLHTRPVAGLPLVHVETPTYEGTKRFMKRAFDLVVSAGLIVVLSPLLIVLALMVKFGSKGPVLFRQERVGLNGTRFNMLKFRSMVIDAEAQLADLHAVERDEGNAVLFKMKDDPRVTGVGRVLRRTSMDELPQLFNVFVGSMSIVGPRPPLPDEVELYDSHVHRRFLVKPGITGLWQVSGRSSLSWEDSVRLDLYYVENWSLANDLVILLKTAKAVVARTGAY